MVVDPRALAETLLAESLLAGGADTEALAATAWCATIHAPPAPDDGPALPRLSLAPPAAGEAASGHGPAADFALRAVLGRGGMGVVWLAEQASLRRSVAVKMPLHAGNEPGDALLREARISGSLDHPNIVPVHALGVADDGRPVLVMKRVVGATLRELAADPTRRAWQELLARYGDREAAIAETLARVADAIAFAHARGVVHRDLKPENVMVGEFGEVYVMDWGCAVPLDSATRPRFAGTPAFMAPEMLDAARGPIDARTDVYLLGATLHAALTGRPRHEGPTLEAVVGAALASRAFEYDASVSPGLAELCNRATHPDPAARYASASAFREARGHALRLRATTKLADRIAARAAIDADPGTDTSAARLEQLEEARHALAPLVAEWPDHPRFRVMLDRVLRELVRVALAQRLAPIAEEALAALQTPDPALHAEVTRLRAELDDAQRLAALGESTLHERDVRPTVKGFVALVVFMALNAVVLVGTILEGEEPPMREVVATDLVALAVLGAATYAFRASLTANRRGRASTAGAWLVLLGMTACDALAAFAGLSAREAVPFSLLSAAAGFAALTVLLDMPRRARIATALCGAVLAAEAFWSAAAPALATRLMSVSIVQTALAAGYFVLEMIREGRERRSSS